MTSRLQMTLVIAKSHSEKITFAALMTEQMQHQKRASDDEKNIAGNIIESNSKRQTFTKNRTFCQNHYLLTECNNSLPQQILFKNLVEIAQLS